MQAGKCQQMGYATALEVLADVAVQLASFAAEQGGEDAGLRRGKCLSHQQLADLCGESLLQDGDAQVGTGRRCTLEEQGAASKAGQASQCCEKEQDFDFSGRLLAWTNAQYNGSEQSCCPECPAGAGIREAFDQQEIRADPDDGIPQ